MKIIISSLPNNPWWGNGTPQYEDNPAMVLGTQPNQELLEREWKALAQMLTEKSIALDIIPFPSKLDGMNSNKWKHDFVFVRDLYVGNQRGDVVIARFREKERQGEVKIIEEWLVDQDVNVHTLPNDDDHFIEGGEFYYCSNENILFAGESRNSRKGNEKTAELLDVEELVILRSNSFHLDTLCTPVFNSDNQLCLLIACTALLEKESVNQLRKMMHNRNIPILEVPPEEAIGTTNKLGSFAVNCLPLPGQLIGAAEFKSETVRTALIEHNITHSVVSLTQFHLSGGSVHCLTNEL